MIQQTQTNMKNLKGYKVEQIGNLFYVTYQFRGGDGMLMSRGYKTESGCNKRFDSIVYSAGIK